MRVSAGCDGYHARWKAGLKLHSQRQGNGRGKRSTGVSLAIWVPHLEGFWVPEITLMFPKVNSWKGYGGGYDMKRVNRLIFSSLDIYFAFL